MKKNMTEQKVLNKLDIPDFRHLTKDKVIHMASLLDKMDPEVAKKALEQFPNFSGVMKDVLCEYKNSLDVAYEQNSESIKSYYYTCDEIIVTCQKMLDTNQELSFEQKRQVIDLMLQVAKLKEEKDSENKRFLATLSVTFTVALGITAGVLLTALGGNVLDN